MENPVKFGQEVKAELRKVVWPSRRETTVTTIMVLVMVVIAAVFFLGVDQIVSTLVKFLLSWA